jgi:hypothetical protein
MATYPYRFECDIEIKEKGDAAPKIAKPDPVVRVFLGDTYTNDNTGEKKLNKQNFKTVGVKLSNLEEFITAGISGLPEKMLPKMDPMGLMTMVDYFDEEEK